MAVRWLIVRVFHPSSPVGRQATSPANASSVPGNRQTAMPGSSAAAKPRVPVPKSRVISLSPTFAGRERTLWRLKSHIGDSFFHSQDSWVFPRQTPHYPQTTRSSKNGAGDLQQDLTAGGSCAAFWSFPMLHFCASSVGRIGGASSAFPPFLMSSRSQRAAARNVPAGACIFHGQRAVKVQWRRRRASCRKAERASAGGEKLGSAQGARPAAAIISI